MKVCTVKDCHKPHWAKGRCKPHYLESWRKAHPGYHLAKMREYRHSYTGPGPRKVILGVFVDVHILQPGPGRRRELERG